MLAAGSAPLQTSTGSLFRPPADPNFREQAMPSAGMEDALGLVADCCHFLAFAALLFKLCVFARSDQQKERACRDVSLKTQVGLTAAYALRYMDLWRKPKRSLEPLLKYASKLPSWRKLSAANLVALHKAGAAYALVIKVFVLTGGIACSTVLLWRRYWYPSISDGDPVPFHMIVSFALIGQPPPLPSPPP